jgi:hypothetical protein
MVIIFIPLIPWRYIAKHYILLAGDRWKLDKLPPKTTP